MNLQLPVEAEARLHAQGRGRCLVLGRIRSAQEHQPFAGLRAHLKPAQLLLAGLWKPGDQGTCGVGLDELFGHPQALSRCFCLDPYEMSVVQPLVREAWQVRVARRTNDHDLAARCNDAAQRRAQQTPFDDARLGAEYFRHRLGRPTAARQLGIESIPA